MYNRNNTRKIMVGNVQIGGQNKVIIQSMCNTKTKGCTSHTVAQILDLEEAGCEIVRVACLDLDDAKAIKENQRRIFIFQLWLIFTLTIKLHWKLLKVRCR